MNLVDLVLWAARRQKLTIRSDLDNPAVAQLCSPEEAAKQYVTSRVLRLTVGG